MRFGDKTPVLNQQVPNKNLRVIFLGLAIIGEQEDT
jgi:hypothetical protein